MSRPGSLATSCSVWPTAAEIFVANEPSDNAVVIAIAEVAVFLISTAAVASTTPGRP